jgi:hypothetical protein
VAKRNLRIRISRLTKKELELIRDEANFTEEQEKIFVQLNKDQYYDVGIMTELGIAPKQYYAIKRVVVDKVERIATDHGFVDRITAEYW